MKVFNDQIENSVDVDPNSKGLSVGVSYTSYVAPTNGLMVQSNVGIGTTTPTQNLHVQGNFRLTGAYYDANNSTGSSSNLLTSTATGTAWSTAVQLGIVTGTGAATQITYWSNANQLTGISTFVYSNNNVGIGTASPTQNLHVQGSMRLTGSFYDVNNSTGSSGNLLTSTATGTAWSTAVQLGVVTGTGAANQIAYWGSSNQITGISTFVYLNGNIGLGTANPLTRLHVETTAAGNKGIYVAGAASQTGNLLQIDATTSGANYVTVSGIGSVGIATASPSQLFHVQGNMRLTGAHFDSANSAGASGTILTSTVTGTAWSTAVQLGVVTGTGAATQIAYWNNANQIVGISTFVYSNNNVGIGTATPANLLTVQGDSLMNTMTLGLGSGQNATNTVLGYQAAQFYTAATNACVAIGYQAGQGAATTLLGAAVSNVTVGYLAGNLYTGNAAVGVGYLALAGSTARNSTGNNATAVGFGALQFITANNNTAVGYQAAKGTAAFAVSGAQNTAVGASALSGLRGGSNNTCVGFSAGSAINGGDYNVLIGSNADVAAAGQQWSIALGTSVVPTASNLGAWGGRLNSNRTDLGIGSFTPLARLHVETLAAANKGLYIAGFASQSGNLLQIDATTSGTNYVTVSGIGSVGIGTATPSQLFHIQGNARLTGSLFDSTNSSGASGNLLTSTATGTAWSTAVQLGVVTGTGAATQISYWSNANQITGISTFVYSNNNVGIGTATPSQLLHIQGNARLTGSLFDTNNLAGTPVGIVTSALFSTGTGVTWAPIKRSLVTTLLTAWTPTTTGIDAAVFIVPQDPNDGTSSMSFTMKRVNVRVETPSTGITTINISKSTGTGVFSGTNILSSNINVTGASTYEFNSTTFTGFGATANSGDKFSVNFVGTAPTFANFTVELIARET